MKLPNPDRAIVDIAKLRSYCLDPMHPTGGHKARVFRAALGLTASNAEWLRARLLEAVWLDGVDAGETQYGKRCVIDFKLPTAAGEVVVRSSWIVRPEDNFPRLTSCYVR